MNKFLYILFPLSLLVVAVVFVNKINVNFLGSESAVVVSDNSLNNKGELRLSATIFPLYDILKNVTGDLADVNLIVPAGASPHTYEFSPKDLGKMKDVKVIFSIGHNLDNWTYSVKDSFGDIEIFTVDNDIKLRILDEENGNGLVDPHYWLSFDNAIKITDTITDKMISLDPENKKVYERNAFEYQKKLEEKKKELLVDTEKIKGSQIVTFHDAWRYFAEDFGFNIAGVFRKGSAEEPSPKHLVDLQNKIRELKIKVMFGEYQSDDYILKSFVKDNKMEMAVLDDIGGIEGKMSYLEMMEYNVNTIVKALGDVRQ